ncbi:response regulator transcription factor [Undibacterium piscinae]|jgi:DNA-binding NarL/FixJ family response regulator|uniref:Response regulator transcription factor n=1 Tax=Undibacterium piscinae TaxID=2495591 RepID=A0A6M4A6P1_9BURK|nr:response regulator transcription factor [Undibacterium piscinae]
MKTENKIRVVIVDDYDMTRTLLKIILRGEQFDVIGEATDGQSGVEMCLKLKPDIILLDVIMPIMNGIDALEKIRAHLPQTLVMMVTGNDDESVVNEAIKKGASGYIVKPFNTASVIETMNQAREKFILRNPASLQNQV